MVEVRAEYVNLQKITKTSKTDYFVYTNLEVKGHAEHTGYTNNTKVCAGISACCNGIKRLVAEYQYHLKIEKGYFRVWLEKQTDFMGLDKESVYAINTLVCQLFEIWKEYPKAFKSFDIVDVKENYDYEQISKSNKQRIKRWREHRKDLGLYPCDEGEHH